MDTEQDPYSEPMQRLLKELKKTKSLKILKRTLRGQKAAGLQSGHVHAPTLLNIVHPNYTIVIYSSTSTSQQIIRS